MKLLQCLTAATLLMAATAAYAADGTSYTTTGDRTQSLRKRTLSLSTTPTSFVVQLDTATHYQTMDGFGAAMTGSTCYNLLQMQEQDREKFLRQTFSTTDGYGFSYMRISIGCSDFSLSEFTCCDTPGIQNFGLTDEDLNVVIPMLKRALEINPDLKFIASPWTCPIWMKVNNLNDLKPYEHWTSGQLNPKHYQDYATYFVKWVQAYEEQGIPIYAITVQNEPLNRGNSASLFMGWEEQQDFVANALGPAFRKAGLNTKIYAFDHNYNYDNMADQQRYPLKVYSNAKAASFLSGAAYHNYGGNREELLKVGEARPNKELIFTETSIGMWNDGRNLAKRLPEDMREVALGTVNNGCKAAIVWNLMLDTDRGPNRPGGCTTCYGAVDINKTNWKSITMNSHYYIIAHMSTVVKPGATRIGGGELTDALKGVTYSAFRNTDGSLAVVILNETAGAKNLSFTIDGTNYAKIMVPAGGVSSITWQQETGTGIRQVKEKKSGKDIYTLSGRKADKPIPGEIYVIDNKKTLIKG